MKVALCISGHLRSFEETSPDITSRILNLTSPDIFIHTWDMMGFDVGRGDGESVNWKTIDYMDKIGKLFNPKKIVIEDFFQQDKSIYKDRVVDTRDPANVLGMFYKIKKCNELKIQYEQENNFKYDVVIRFRADMRPDTALNVLDFNHLNDNDIFLPQVDYHLGYNDKFAFGRSSAMDKYSSCFDKIAEYYNKGCLFNAEAIMRAHLVNEKSNIKRCNLRYTLCKPSGFKFSNT